VRDFDWGARRDRPAVERDDVLTVPNAITLVRLLGLPVFAWLVLGRAAYGQAFAVLVAVGATDWVDGYVARRFDQVSRLGKLLDPLVDRLLLATAGIVLLVAGLLPWWIVLLVVGRDLLVLAGVALVFRGVPTVPVSKTGKFATACLLIGIPGFLLAAIDWRGATVALVLAYAYSLVGVVAYWVAGVGYARTIRSDRRGALTRGPS
jgi:cardiolipin synthase (CMP-forming)